ncbi:MAG: hypothetical protein CL878_05280 [Dehalococcoidia bacterium]|nr:hypothetical protein [Dehalococcoidia bacterium]
MPKYIEINENEAWAIDHTIRHTYQEGQQNVGKDLLLKAMNIVLEFEEQRTQPYASQDLPLALTEAECWAVDHQIRCDVTFNSKPVGRSLLLKVFRLLTEYANERDSQLGVDTLDSLADLLRRPPSEAESTSDQPSDEQSPDSEPDDPAASPERPK